jgi:hypothetical protein
MAYIVKSFLSKCNHQRSSDVHVEQHNAGTFMRRIYIVLAALMVMVAGAGAQTWQGGLDLLLGSPQREFRKNVERIGVGALINAGYAPEGTPIMIGLEVGFMNYGSSDRREPFSTTIPDVFVRVSTTNNFILGHAVVRLQPNAGVFRPYIQGMVGFNYLFTETKIENENHLDQEVASSTNLSDGAFSYGGGAGLMFLVYRPDNGTVSDVFVDLGARYVFGGEAEYLKEGSIRSSGGRVSYDVLKSKTDLLEFTAGVSVRF